MPFGSICHVKTKPSVLPSVRLRPAASLVPVPLPAPASSVVLVPNAQPFTLLRFSRYSNIFDCTYGDQSLKVLEEASPLTLTLQLPLAVDKDSEVAISRRYAND